MAHRELAGRAGRRWLLLALACVLLAVPALLAPGGPAAAAPNPLVATSTRSVTAWVPYWRIDAAMASVRGNWPLVTDVTTFFHSATGRDGRIISEAPPAKQAAVVAEVRAQRRPVLAAVADRTPPGTMAAILADPAKRAAHIAALLEMMRKGRYSGLDIDYEQFAFADGKGTWSATRPHWVAFIRQLGAALDDRGKLLAVSVPPMTGAQRGYWVYDWRGIARAVDQVRVMAYDYSTATPGPIAPLTWVQQTTRYGLAAVGRAKLRLGVPTYGRDWAVGSSGARCSTAGVKPVLGRSAADALAVAAANRSRITWHAATAEASFRYTQRLPGCTVQRTVHLADARAVAARAAYARSVGIGVALWAVGADDPGMWPALRRQAGR
jgi:spore germination protein YaaH